MQGIRAGVRVAGLDAQDSYELRVPLLVCSLFPLNVWNCLRHFRLVVAVAGGLAAPMIHVTRERKSRLQSKRHEKKYKEAVSIREGA